MKALKILVENALNILKHIVKKLKHQINKMG